VIPLRRSALLAGVVIAALILAPLPVLAEETGQPEETNTAKIMGKLITGEKKTPVVGATVLAYHLSLAQLFRSQPTGENGKFVIEGLPHGYFDMAVDSPDGVYVSEQVVNAGPGAEVVANFNLAPSDFDGADPREFPGSSESPVGIAEFMKKKSKKAIWILVGVGSAAVLALVLAGSDSEKKSPSTP
jgi:hypothetical protein